MGDFWYFVSGGVEYWSTRRLVLVLTQLENRGLGEHDAYYYWDMQEASSFELRTQ